MTGAMIARRPAALDEVRCDNCGAGPGEACRDRDGATRYLAHLSRQRAAVLVQTHQTTAVLSTRAHVAAQGNAL
jgi:hypothetical protein